MTNPDWPHNRPATTIAGDARVWAPGHKVNADDLRRHADARERYGDRAGTTAIRVTPEEAAILQSYPPFPGAAPSGVDYSKHVVLDLFAGSGVGVAIRELGAEEYGVEIMKEAILTRNANRMTTVFHDVWDSFRADDLDFDTLWASPPCQAFSMAGHGAGRKALSDVLDVIRREQYVDIEDLQREAIALGDERIGLVLTPLHYTWRFAPTYVALEQVPPVLPVWEAMAEVMREWGYSVWTGILNAEQYGVPQTRKRAILMARRDGDVQPPTPTHSKYYPRDPEKLDRGVKKWVSMAEALGWTNTGLVGFPRRYDGRGDAVEIDGVAYRGRDLRPTVEPAQTVTEKARSWSRFDSVATTGGDA